jgi:hypothetical protein
MSLSLLGLGESQSREAVPEHEGETDLISVQSSLPQLFAGFAHTGNL